MHLLQDLRVARADAFDHKMLAQSMLCLIASASAFVAPASHIAAARSGAIVMGPNDKCVPASPLFTLTSSMGTSASVCGLLRIRQGCGPVLRARCAMLTRLHISFHRNN